MENDAKLLTKISEKFTVETLKTIISQATGEKIVTINGWQLETAESIGDNFLSIIYRVTIDCTAGGINTQVKTVIKGLPKNWVSRQTFRSADFFKNEIIFYSQV